jgi:uncharacterized membrane protein YadS
VPSFVLGFVGMSALRTTGDLSALECGAAFGLLDPAVYKAAVTFVGSDVSQCALGTAMAAVGLSTSASVFKGVGWRPFAVGMSGSLVVAGTGFGAVTALHAAGMV